jgi:hypothetical protein
MAIGIHGRLKDEEMIWKKIFTKGIVQLRILTSSLKKIKIFQQ